MLILYGETVHSAFRLAQLLAKLQLAQAQAGVVSLATEAAYFIDAVGEADLQLLKQLLTADSTSQLTSSEHQLIIVPRIGTISPWSSKATAIAEACGLGAIKRIERGIIYHLQLRDPRQLPELAVVLQDRMTESVLWDLTAAEALFSHAEPRTYSEIPLLERGLAVLSQVNKTLGLALSEAEMQYLYEQFRALGRDPSDLELMTFAQANSEHCRHKIFNADWLLNGKPQNRSLFDMIRYTYQCHPEGVISAYSDNGAIVAGPHVHRWLLDPHTHIYGEVLEPAHMVIKVETHNHPTGISPTEGAATGSGGEIRDEGAVGRGAKPKAGLVGFTVSNLRIPQFLQPWEQETSKPDFIASALDIMLEAPIGASSFNNEFGRPSLSGYFRTFEMGSQGYHKPIMIAGGLGNVRDTAVHKEPLPDGAKIIVLGGPAMLIGLGGGAASSMASGTSDQALDFASVQRSNPQLQRCCQEVIDACWALGNDNPVLSIHDVGAGGLANALSELVHQSAKGACIDLRAIPSAEPGMTPLEIWCNEAQERYVLAVLPSRLQDFVHIAERERCPYAVLGEVEASESLVVEDPYFNNKPAQLPFSVLFANAPKLLRVTRTQPIEAKPAWDLSAINLADAASRVLQLPCVADKSFLITIGDRSIGGLVARDQMVGPWQVPVADVAVTAHSFSDYTGEAMAMGERPPVALVDPAISACLAVGEAITNIAAAYIGDISAIKLSANWMAAGDEGLYEAVQAVAMELCPALGICIPVGKDSLSMRTQWTENGEQRSVTSPLSLIVSAFAQVLDIRKTLTPLLTLREETELLLIDISQVDISHHERALAGSALAQVYQLQSTQPPFPVDPAYLKAFFQAIQTLHARDLLLAYHDRSDGGLFVSLCEMAFASRVGLDIHLDSVFADNKTPSEADWLAALFHEGLGAVVQVRSKDTQAVQDILQAHGLLDCTHVLGRPNTTDQISIKAPAFSLPPFPRTYYQRLWSATSYHMQSLRDHPECAQQAYDRLLDTQDPGLFASTTFDLQENVLAPYINTGVRPRVAILREQGVNGHIEMAAAFARAGFTCIDVHMSDILQGRQSLENFNGLVACGGFSYGDVLGSGQGWAKSILFNTHASKQFAEFFARETTFTLGVCNGCQMLSWLTELIPGSQHWPRFKRNRSEQFEARLVMVAVEPSPSLFFRDMQGSHLPIVVSHGEGRAEFPLVSPSSSPSPANPYVTLRFIDAQAQATEHYPENPNGSPGGITGLTSVDGRVTIVMPHPERVFRSVQFSWHPDTWLEDSPWMRMFQNARVWVG